MTVPLFTLFLTANFTVHGVRMLTDFWLSSWGNENNRSFDPLNAFFS